jgi:hypothetical protein
LAESIGKAYKPYLLVSLTVLIGSLVLLGVVGTIAFIGSGTGSMPLWQVVLGVVAVLGLAAGFGGFLLIMLVAGWQSFRAARKVQVISPER